MISSGRSALLASDFTAWIVLVAASTLCRTRMIFCVNRHITDPKGERLSDTQTEECGDRKNGSVRLSRCFKDFANLFISEASLLLLIPARGMVMSANEKFPQA